MSDILDGMQGAPGFLMASFSILTRFGSLETLLYVQRGEPYLWSIHISLPLRNEHTREALLGIYLERGSVHVGIQKCTREYTMVYTRVYFSLLGSR